MSFILGTDRDSDGSSKYSPYEESDEDSDSTSDSETSSSSSSSLSSSSSDEEEVESTEEVDDSATDTHPSESLGSVEEKIWPGTDIEMGKKKAEATLLQGEMLSSGFP